MILIQCYSFILLIPGYLSLHQTRRNRRVGGLCIFLIESLSYKVRNDLAINFSSTECLCAEVFNKNSKSIVLNLTYRSPNGDPNHFEKIILKIFFQNGKLPIRN